MPGVNGGPSPVDTMKIVFSAAPWLTAFSFIEHGVLWTARRVPGRLELLREGEVKHTVHVR
jgi:hypothetical protein